MDQSSLHSSWWRVVIANEVKQSVAVKYNYTLMHELPVVILVVIVVSLYL